MFDERSGHMCEDPLDAVDLGLVPEELDGVVRSDLTALYEAFRK